jgi:hypothetical protein
MLPFPLLRHFSHSHFFFLLIFSLVERTGSFTLFSGGNL